MKFGSAAASAIALSIAISCAAGVRAETATGPLVIDRATASREIAQAGFAAAEETRLAAAASGDLEAVLELSRFYMASGLWVEALARVRDIEDPAAMLIAAECEYRMGRYRAVVARLESTSARPAILGISYARLGSFDEARKIFDAAPQERVAADLTGDLIRAKAETYAETGALDLAAAALSGGAGAVGFEASNFIVAKIRGLRGDQAGAATALRRAASGEDNEWSMRARLALLNTAGEVDAIERLMLERRGGPFEREALLSLGRIRLSADDFDRGFRALHKLVNTYPESLAALDAQSLIEKALPKLLDDESGVTAKDAARLFFENVEYAPAGAEGDKLIRSAAAKLSALGLYRQAAQIMEHQVFNRLRGAERSRVAADLAELHLEAKDPQAALRDIRSTRIAGLSDDMNARRRHIEARALVQAGKAESALGLLSDAPQAADLKLRGDINWNRKLWADAARDYVAYISARTALDARSDRDLAVRAATAFLLAGDVAGYRSFAGLAAQKMNGAPELSLINSLGDVDQAQFLAKALESYRAVYAGR
jgi:hypothetical protein